MKSFFSWFSIMVERIMAKLYPMSSTDNETPLKTPDFTPSSVPAPILPNQLPNTPSKANLAPSVKLADFLKWQWQFEGAVPSNNNRGNYRFYHGGYLPIYGNVKCSVGGFAMFPTLAQGDLYATNCTKSVIKNHPELTILTYLGGNGAWGGYAPASDHNPVLAYATFIAKGLGVGINFLMKNLIV